VLAPDLIHVFSYTTGVSLELPRGFTALTDDGAGQSYVLVGDEPDGRAPEIAAFVDIRTLATEGIGYDEVAGQRAATAVVDGLAAHAGVELARDWCEIDLEQVLRAELRCPNGLPGVPGPSGAMSTAGAVADFLTGDLLVVVAALAFDERLVSITAAAPWPAHAAWRDVFDVALRSARFLPGGGA
jgi:hypothetical protein